MTDIISVAMKNNLQKDTGSWNTKTPRRTVPASTSEGVRR